MLIFILQINGNIDIFHHSNIEKKEIVKRKETHSNIARALFVSGTPGAEMPSPYNGGARQW